ncbi:hypothetical protein F2Q68_00015079 [Brassica cretica]|uniref:Uncharacterized protein n=1 Tax=Brassica cretica TaxID=69181 RepID=A0A8S9HK26_BRACR|nr:hypothetical protein F2Q68_00015079 [Brassica cretica]
MSPNDTSTAGGQPSVAFTPVAVTENVTEMLQAIMARFAQQDKDNKATNDRLAAFTAALGTLDGEGQETKECKQLFGAWLASYSSSQVTVEPPKQKSTKNNKGWSKSKDKKKKSQIKSTEEFPEEDNANRQDDDSTSDEEKPKSRRKIFTIRTASSPAAAVTGPPKEDLWESPNHKATKTIDSLTFPAAPRAVADDKETRTLNT